jgi:hypothetical protein
LYARRSIGEWRLTIAAPNDETQKVLHSLGALSVEEVPVSFNEAMIGYLGERGRQPFFFEDTTLLEKARGLS